MTTNLKEQFNQLLRDDIAPYLKKFGFKKDGNSFFHKLDDIQWVINLQSSKWNDEDEFQFTVNIGVYIPGLMKIFLNRKEPLKIGIEHCGISSRIGMLTDKKLDSWWKITKTSTPASILQISSEIKKLIELNCLPFLNKYKNRVEVANFLERKRKKGEEQIAPQNEAYSLTYAAIIYSLITFTDKSKKCIKSAIDVSKGSEIEEIIEEIAKRL